MAKVAKWYIKDGKRIPVYEDPRTQKRETIFKVKVDPKRVGDLSSHALDTVFNATKLERYVNAFIEEYVGKKKQDAAADVVEIRKIIKELEFSLNSVKSAFMRVDAPHDEMSVR